MYSVITFCTVSKLACSKPPAILYISFWIFDSIIVIIASAVSEACSQLRIGEPLLCNGIFLPKDKHLHVLGISFSVYCPIP